MHDKKFVFVFVGGHLLEENQFIFYMLLKNCSFEQGLQHILDAHFSNPG